MNLFFKFSPTSMEGRKVILCSFPYLHTNKSPTRCASALSMRIRLTKEEG